MDSSRAYLNQYERLLMQLTEYERRFARPVS